MNIPVTQPGAMNVPVTQPGVMNIPAPQILNTSTTPTSSMLIFSNSATTVTTGNFPTILQSNITNITSIQPKNNTGKGIQSSITPAACSTSTISSSASMNGSSKSADVTSRSGSTSSISNLTDTSQASSDSEKNNIKSSATSNPTTSEGQVKQEKSNKKLFFKKSGTGYNCKLCKFEVKDEDSFAIHVWNHFHVDQKICKTCQEKTDDHKSCKLVTQVMDGLHSAAEIAAKERKQKVQRNENEQASVNATNNNPSPDEVIILDEETSEEGEKKQSNQDAEGGAETEESSGVSSIKILSTYSLSTSGLNSKRNEPVLEKDERVPPSTGNEQEEAKGNNNDTGILQPFQNVIDRVVENSVIEQQTNSNVTPEVEKTKQKDEAEKTKQKDGAEKTKQKDEENIASTSKHTELTADVQTVSNADASVRKEPLLPVNPLTYFYQCGFQDCGFAAYTSNTYRDHLITVHPKSSQYNCIHCGHKSMTDESHMRHIIGHSKYASSVLFVCGEGCKFGTNLLSAFKEHVLKIHPNLLDYKCASCKEIFQNIEDLIRHLELNKLQFVLCPHCTFKDRNRRTVMKHLSEVHPGKPRQITVTSQLVCLERCLNNYTPPTVTPTLFVRKEDEKAEKVESTEVKSKATVESSNTKGNIEDIAKERVSNDDIEPSIETEERNTTGDIPSSKCTTDNSYFQCTHCTYLTQSRGQLGNHILNHSRPRSTRAFACLECSSGNDNLPQFSSHMKHHEGEFKVKVYMCFHCPFQTNQRDKMVTHGLKKHSSGVPDVDFSVRTHRYRQQAFHCKYCEYIHKDEKVFNDHVQNCRGSDGSKMSRVMDYPTKESDTIDNPMRASDTTDNPIKAFDTMNNPTKASDTEDEEQPPRPHISKKFSCSQCRRGFDRVAQLKQHMNIHLMKENFIDLFKCGYCPFLSTYEHLVPKHIQEKHPKYKISVKQKREYLNTTVSHEENTSFESSNDIDLLHCDCCSFSCNDVQELAQHTAVHLSGARAETKSVEPTKVKKPYEGPKKKFHIPFGNIFKENVHCTECSFKTKRRLELLRHIKSHENLDPVSQFAERKENSASDHNKRPFLKIKFGKRKSSDNLTSNSKKRRLSDSPSDVSDNDEWEPPLSPVSKKKQVAVKSTTQSPKSNSLPSFYYLGGDVLDLKLRPCYSKDEEEPMYECLFCKDVFEEKYTLHRHLLQHMNVSFFKCSYCDHGDLETSTLVTHIQKEHHKPIKHEQIDQKEIESRINKVIHDMKAEEYWGPSENENLKPEKEGLKQEMQSSYEDEKSCSYNDGGDENDSFQTISNANIKQEPLDPEAEIQSTPSSCASENSFYPSDGKSPRLGPLPPCVVMMGRFFKCTVCNYRLDNRSKIVLHASKHSSRKRNMCSACTYRSHYKGDVNKHVKMVHQGAAQLVYDFEDIEVDSQFLLLDEIRRQNFENNDNGPNFTPKPEKIKVSLDDSNSKGNSKSLYENSIKRHIKKQHPKATCNILPIRSKMKVVKVSKNIDIEEPSKEENGGNDSTKLTSLKLKIETVPASGKHIDQKPDVNSDLKACPACKFPVNSCKALRIHVHTVHPNHRLLCLYCKEYVTKKVKQLVTHNRLFHGKDGFSDLNFDIIPESEVRSKNLDRRPIFLYKCGLCDHKAQRQPMKFHIFLHFQYNPFKCKYCDMRFKSIKVLQHTRVRHPDKKLEYDYEKDEKLEKEITNMLNNGRYQTISQSSYKMNESGIKGAKENSVEKELDEKEETEDDLDDVNPEEKGVENENDDSISRGDPNHMFSPCHNYTVDYDMKTGKSIYQCSICPYNTTVIKTITNHFYHHVPHVFKCPYCSYQNYPRSKVVCHLKYKHPKKTVHVVDLRNKMKDLKFREYEMEVENPVKAPKPRRSEHGKPPRKKPKGLEKFEDIFTSEESDDDNQSSKTDGSHNGRLIYCCNYCTNELESLYHYRQHLATHGGFVHQVPGSQIESRLKCGYCKPIDVIKDQRSSCLIEENTPSRQVMLVEMDPKVRLNDILAIDAADFENLLTKHGVSVIDLNFILDEKFERVSKTLGLHEDVVEEKDDGLSDISEDENLGETENEVTESD
ncbi:hypothetical protein FSP39_010256 [Pinctada imbricata]|uniref:C2H2-type domain-containing protein n=1 Tax=Pinctada imbricata TaxID=66713 RepID=A0AA88XF18_PINIB|nr:hypothetical protein FSP39_010256 [Pinctada imbricata]